MSQFQSNTNAPSSGPAGSNQLVLIGLVIAIIAVVLMNFYVEMRVRAQKEDTVTFFRFDDDMKAGEKIEATDLNPVQLPKSWAGAFGLSAIGEDPDNPGRPLDGLNNTLLTAVSKEQILTSNLIFGAGTSTPRDPAYARMDEITLNIDSKKQTPNLRPGDFVDLRASVPLNRNTKFMTVMEYVKVVNLGDRIQETGSRTKNTKYGSITIYIEPELSNKLLDVQKRVEGQTFSITRRDPQDKEPRDLKTGGSKEINQEVLDILNLD